MKFLKTLAQMTTENFFLKNESINTVLKMQKSDDRQF